ncbi:MAG: hypothetical protein COV59_04940 [Candidatus Magasanikbacteria bacterium CG11_big_fil_rev_8_21_14_0_20_39_34]|uniref:Phosphatidic acid phosphatase type 2/haloperoxidase domain-containing protein n=1 Tax=Candidatus Magasanikbacteria bacterium CG11_big_fil_rev_8_21_14_0_20_39_34 TaxID=1974653 RepID=A0A2H0N3P4_9BACT|nr:MAG: hypothetical protein COV59_04940 [Candidatus Magasanikbacteria bacterium CG11_big_fil_rev_8_21_14_0_20_39_34]
MWSKNLFLKVNAKVGMNPKFDAIMIFITHFGIVFLTFLSLILSWFTLKNLFFSYIFFVLIPLCLFALVLSYSIAFIFRHPRPEKEIPNVRVLISTLGTWKSFPSDHTLFSFILAAHLLLFVQALSPVVVLISFLMLGFASLIGISRVYVGVHYPRDILGGFLLALFCCLLFLFLL